METAHPTGTLIEFPASLENGIISTSLGDLELSELILERKNIVILKKVFDPETIRTLRALLWEWVKNRQPSQDYDGNGFTTRQIEGGQGEQAKLFCRTFWFLNLEMMEPRLRGLLFSFFEPLRNLQNRLARTDHQFTRNADGMRLRPQIVQYPKGGGSFGSHFHPFQPQKIGLIMAMAEQGLDYNSGGTYFKINGHTVHTEGHHRIGDITIFRYDLEHGVSTVDPDKKTDWASDLGRWTMVLPFKDT